MKVGLKRLALTALALLGYLLGLPLWKKIRSAGRGGLRVLRYHSISSDRFHETVVTPEQFRRQMRWLKEHCRVAGPDCVASSNGNSSVLVTFDDGYADNFRHALPILREEGVPAVVFLIAGYVGTDKLLPHDQGLDFTANRLLQWEEARNCDPRWMEFGSHGWSHSRLGSIADESGLWRELHDSKQTIEKELGRPVRFLSFPFGVDGDYDRRVTDMAKRAGYSAAFNAKYGENAADTDAFDLYRIGIERSDNLFTLRAKLNGALDLLRLAETRAGRKLVRMLNRAVGA